MGVCVGVWEWRGRWTCGCVDVGVDGCGWVVIPSLLHLQQGVIDIQTTTTIISGCTPHKACTI